MDVAGEMLGQRSPQTYARIAGVLFLISMFAGGFGEFYVPSTLIVSGDAAATASNIRTFDTMFRLGFASYLVEAVCDIGLTWVLYLLLRPVRRDVALLAVFFGLVSTATFAGAELFFFAPSFILGGAEYLETFSPAQIESLAYLSVRYYAVGSGIFMVFYGIGAILRGYLIFRSGFLPRFIGVLLFVAGIGFVVRNLMLVIAPQYAYEIFLMPMSVAGLALTGWLLIKGIDTAKWNAAAAAS